MRRINHTLDKLNRRAAVREMLKVASGLGLTGLGVASCGGNSVSQMPLASLAVASVVLNTTKKGALLDSRFAGLSYEKSKLHSGLFSGRNTAMIKLLTLLGPSVLRIGGNSVDTSSWMGAIPDLTPIQKSDVDALADFAKASGWSVIYGINMANNTTANLVDEARYATAKLGDTLLGFEIGNEPDLYTLYDTKRFTEKAYIGFSTAWQTMAAALREELSLAILTGPATAYNLDTYTVPFVKQHSSKIAMLTHHYYRGDGKSDASTMDTLLRPDTALQGNLHKLAGAAQGLSMGFRIGECNSFYDGGAPGVSNAYGTALWALDFIFTCALAQCSGVNFHGGGSTSYSPITDNGKGEVTSVRPLFYGMAMFAQLAQGTKGYAVPATVTLDQSMNFTAYGVVGDAGTNNVLLINKDALTTVATTVTVDISIGSMQMLALTGPCLMSTDGILLAGVHIASDGTWSPKPLANLVVTQGQLKLHVPPMSALLLRSA